MLPCGVGSVDATPDSEFCKTSLIVTGVDDPPKNSGLCSLASDDFTPKCDCIISIYLEPPLAFLSSHSCNLNARLSSFIDAAAAVDKSASNCPLGSNTFWLVNDPADN